MKNNHGIKLYCEALTSSVYRFNKDLVNEMIDSDKYKKDGLYNRRVIFATNVAESSVTINGIDHVIDSGIEHVSNTTPRPTWGIGAKDDIQSVPSRRMGRTGRTHPGNCYNLFTKEQYKHFRDYRCPKSTSPRFPSLFFDLCQQRRPLAVSVRL